MPIRIALAATALLWLAAPAIADDNDPPAGVSDGNGDADAAPAPPDENSDPAADGAGDNTADVAPDAARVENGDPQADVAPEPAENADNPADNNGDASPDAGSPAAENDAPPPDTSPDNSGSDNGDGAVHAGQTDSATADAPANDAGDNVTLDDSLNDHSDIARATYRWVRASSPPANSVRAPEGPGIYVCSITEPTFHKPVYGSWINNRCNNAEFNPWTMEGLRFLEVVSGPPGGRWVTETCDASNACGFPRPFPVTSLRQEPLLICSNGNTPGTGYFSRVEGHPDLFQKDSRGCRDSWYRLDKTYWVLVGTPSYER